jgi:hypothetical protein
VDLEAAGSVTEFDEGRWEKQYGSQSKNGLSRCSACLAESMPRQYQVELGLLALE